MRRATVFFAAALLVGLVATSGRAEGPYVRGLGDDGIRIQTVGHPGRHYRHGDEYKLWHGGRGYSDGHHYSARPCPPRYLYPPVPYWGYPRHHVCGPDCGPRCAYAHPSHNFYYRGGGWGFSFGF